MFVSPDVGLYNSLLHFATANLVASLVPSASSDFWSDNATKIYTFLWDDCRTFPLREPKTFVTQMMTIVSCLDRMIQPGVVSSNERTRNSSPSVLYHLLFNSSIVCTVPTLTSSIPEICSIVNWRSVSITSPTKLLLSSTVRLLCCKGLSFWKFLVPL